jgi:hypothetical protein
MDTFSWAFVKDNEYIHWKGYSNQNRNQTIYEMEKIVNVHGCITDFHRYSDLEICVRIEIEERHIRDLYHSLRTCLEISTIEGLMTESRKERIILLNITFSEGTGDLRIDVPSVPG